MAHNPARIEFRELANGSADNNDTLTEKHYRYDGLGCLSRERVRLPTGGLSDKYHYYDGESRQTGSSTWGGAAFGTTSAGFDPFGRPSIIYPPDANPGDDDLAIRLSYEGFRKTRRTVNIGTVNIGTTLSGGTVNETAVSRTEEYDAWGRLIAVTESSGSNGSDVTTTYQYELGDRLTKTTTPLGGGLNQVRTWSYDQRGFLNSECHPEKGTNGNGCTFYSQYDPLGKARQMVDGPFTKKYTFDRAARLTTVRDASDRTLQTFAYGSASTAGNWAEGQLVKVSNRQYPDLGNGPIETRFVEDFTFGGIGGARNKRKVSWLLECQSAFGFTQGDCEPGELVTREVFEHSETLDATGKRQSVQYPVCLERDDGCGPTQPRTVDTTYHASTGFMTGVSGWASSISYHSNMAMSQIQHSNGIVDVLGRDPHSMARPASMNAENSSGDVLWETGTFRFDGAGNLIEQDADTFTDRFIYDGVSRLVTSNQWIAGSTDIFSDGFESGDLSAWALSDIPANEYSEQIFTYDIAGNLTAISTDGTPQIHSISATTNRLAGNGFTYDGAGNLTLFPGDGGVPVQHQYDAFNRLIKRAHGDHVTRYFYTADDERIIRFGTEGFSWTLRDFGGQLLREFKPNASAGMVPQRDHIYRGGSLIGTISPNAAGQLTVKHHYSLDHLGSPRLITDAAGQVEAERKYYPFGEEATLSSQDRHPMKFTGHERDFNESGEGDDLDYMHARQCDPRKGRFLSVDPVQGNPISPQTWNRYAYVLNNPMMLVDPLGLTIEHANTESQRVFEEYVSTLDPDSIDYQNVKALQESEIIFVIEVADGGKGNEGSATFDGEKVTLSVDPTKAREPAAIGSRLAHEVQHGIQMDNGQLGFVRRGTKWNSILTDIGDEVEAYEAQLRQAGPFDLKRGILGQFDRASDKAEFLMRAGYSSYRGRETGRRETEPIPGLPPGTLINDGRSFKRTPRK